MVELRDGSAWRIWPGDIPKTLQWLPTTEIDVADIEDEICSHALVDRSNGSRVRVIRASVVCRRRPALPPRGLSGPPRLGEWTCQVRLLPSPGLEVRSDRKGSCRGTLFPTDFCPWCRRPVATRLRSPVHGPIKPSDRPRANILHLPSG